MVLFDDRRDRTPPLEKQEWTVLADCGSMVQRIDLLQESECDKDETEVYHKRVVLCKSLRFLIEECQKLIDMYHREGIKE